MKSTLFTLTILTIFLFTSTFISCSRSNEIEVNSEPITLNISLEGIESENSTIDKFGSINLQPQTVEIPINSELSAYLELEEDNIDYKTTLSNSKLADTEISPITLGVKYGILVYEGDNLITGGHKVFTAGLESQTEGFALFSGRTYTFIGYSLNSTQLPTVSSLNKLSTAKIDNVSGDLLYYRHQQTMSQSNNILNVKLTHKFTLITTVLKVGTTYSGKIQEVRDANFNYLRQSASIKLSNSNITFDSNTKHELIEFDAITGEGVSTISSTPTLLISESTTNTVTIAIPSIRVNGKTNSIAATTFNFQRGKKYKLNITFNVPCTATSTTGNVSVSSDVNLPNALLGSLTVAKPTSNSDLVFNLKHVDNSFNIFINDNPIFTRQYQRATRTKKSNGTWNSWEEPSSSSSWSTEVAADMEGQYTDGQLVNSMQFGSNSTFYVSNRWGSSGNAQIYNIIGTDDYPSVRVRIDANGAVTITARKYTTSNTLSTLYLRPDFTIPTSNNSNRDEAWFQKITTNNGATESVISKIRFKMNNVVWNSDNTPNKVSISFEQSSKPTVGLVSTSGVTVYNNVSCD